MMNFSGSLRYDMNGRKRKAYKKNNPTVKKAKPIKSTSRLVENTIQQRIEDERKKYPSMNDMHGTGGQKNHLWEQEKLNISQGYTVAPAYNKGAYQVIGKSSIKDIGK
jgi:hypothetical protein